MSLYFVDFENVHDSGINGVTGLTENDEILIFYSMKSEHMSFDTHVSIMQSPAKVKYIKLRRSAKNYLDFQLVTHLGFVIGSGMPGPYYIISKDTGYDSVVDYWKDHGVTILRQPSIGYNRTQRKATGQAPVHQTPPAQVLIKDGNTIKEYQVPSIHFSSDSRSDDNLKASGTARDADASGTSSNRNAARDASTSDDSSTINVLEALGIAESPDTSDFSSTSEMANEDTADIADMPFTSDDTDELESSVEHSDAAPQTDDHETELIMAFPENVDVPAQSGSQEASQDVDTVMTQEESMEASQESIPEDSLESSAEGSKVSQEKKSRSSRNRRNNSRKKSVESSSAQTDKSQSENASKEEANSREETNSKEGANSKERTNSKERAVSKESDTSGKASKDGKTSAKTQQSDVDGIPGEIKISPQTLPESYRKKVRTALRGKNLPSAYYSSIYKAIINSYDKLALNNLLVKTFGNSKGGEIYNLIRDIFTDYQSVLG